MLKYVACAVLTSCRHAADSNIHSFESKAIGLCKRSNSMSVGWEDGPVGSTSVPFDGLSCLSLLLRTMPERRSRNPVISLTVTLS